MRISDWSSDVCSSDLEYPANRFVADFVGSVNIFEGKLSLDDPDKAAIDCPGLGKIYLNHGVTGPHGADVWVALRPEKIYLNVPGVGKAVKAAAQDAPEGHNFARGTIKGMSNLGDITLSEIEIETRSKESVVWGKSVSVRVDLGGR